MASFYRSETRYLDGFIELKSFKRREMIFGVSCIPSDSDVSIAKRSLGEDLSTRKDCLDLPRVLE